MIKTIGRKIKMIVVVLLAILISYYTYTLISTQHIMMDLKQIENGRKIENSAYKLFQNNKKIDHVRRYFTWCWGEKGAIWMSYHYTYIKNGKTTFEDGEIIGEGGDFVKLVIEKNNGKWVVVRVEGEP